MSPAASDPGTTWSLTGKGYLPVAMAMSLIQRGTTDFDEDFMLSDGRERFLEFLDVLPRVASSEAKNLTGGKDVGSAHFRFVLIVQIQY